MQFKPLRVTALTVLLPLALNACASVPVGEPDAVASQLLVDLDAGNTNEADQLFERVEGNSVYRDKIYPVLYGEAAERYGTGDVQGAGRLLRFMHANYPGAVAVPEALACSLFIERAQKEEADPELLDELGSVLESLEGASSSPWLDLARAQVAIDQANLPAARTAFDRFLANWAGEPGPLFTYVEDVDRYLSSH